MSCPHLEYRRAAGDLEFDHERPYCQVTEEFVGPMKADICNARHDFDYETHCEVYRRAAQSERRAVETELPND